MLLVLFLKHCHMFCMFMFKDAVTCFVCSIFWMLSHVLCVLFLRCCHMFCVFYFLDAVTCSVCSCFMMLSHVVCVLFSGCCKYDTEGSDRGEADLSREH